VDEKGRLKIPSGFLHLIETNYGSDVYVTSLTGDNVRIYPMEVWVDFERKLSSMPDFHPTKLKLLKRASYYGQATTLDRQGRLVIPSQLREPAKMKGAVAVLGSSTFLEVWNEAYFVEKLGQEPLTEDDFRALSEYDV
jgi:MraZ protein